MSSIPIALWNLKVPSGGIKIPGYDDEEGSPLPYRITMAAIDSSTPSSKPSTLKLHKRIVTAVDEDDEDEGSMNDDNESVEEEFVICTLEAGKTYQQTLDITMPEDDEIYFSASGDLPIYLSGNYVTPLNMESDSESEDDDDEDGLYDLSPDEDELLLEDDSEDDELDDIDEDELNDLEGRIEEIMYKPPADDTKISEPPPKGTKRPHEEDEAPQLVDTSGKSSEIDTTGLSKSQKKKLKKRKLESDEAVPVNGAEKKVQFAAKLEQGPTETTDTTIPAKPAISEKAKSADVKSEKKKVTLAKKVTLTNGVTIEDHKVGDGPKAKNGTKLGIRYIGKLSKNGKIFDKNTKGKPFRFTLGKGEVIKGWDIGLEGIQIGGERKIHIPAAMAYGSKAIPDIPPNSDLIFEVKCVALN